MNENLQLIQTSSRFGPKPDFGKPGEDTSVSTEGSKYHDNPFDKVPADFASVIVQSNQKFSALYNFYLNHFFHAIIIEYLK